MRYYFISFLLLVSGCSFAPNEKLMFPDRSVHDSNRTEYFDIDGNGKNEFGITVDGGGNSDQLLYDDNEDGVTDRIYRLDDYDTSLLPHVVILLDSVPFQSFVDRFERGDFRWFTKPQKVISVFPSLTEVCYTEVFQAPPLPGMIDTQYDPRVGGYRNDLWKRLRGIEQPWERRTHYHADYLQHGMSFLNPKGWYQAELQRAYNTISESADRVSYIYFASAASLACKYGDAGIKEVLDGARKLCLQLLYERRGAIQISMMADHGHNLVRSKNVSIETVLKRGGLNVTDSLKADRDVIISINGLVTCGGIHTLQPERVSDILINEPATELTIYRDKQQVMIRSSKGTSAIEASGSKTRYLPLGDDVLGYAAVVESMRATGDCDADGFADRQAWLKHTVNHQWPVAPVRLWDAFNRLFESPPTMIFTMKDGYCAGKPDYEKWITMQSTHGGLNQVNSATFITTMRRKIEKPQLQRDVLNALGVDPAPRVLR